MRQELPTRTAGRKHRANPAGKRSADRDLNMLGRAAGAIRHSIALIRRDCQYKDKIRGRSHAYHVMDIHRMHGCERYAMAAYYLAGAVKP